MNIALSTKKMARPSGLADKKIIMQVIKTDIEGVLIIEPRLFRDARGYFFESFSQREFDEKVRHIDFCQDNESMSSYGVMRGLHFQRPPYSQSKLVRCVRGKSARRSCRHSQRLANLWKACRRRADRGQPPTVLHSTWLCPWILRTVRDRCIPVQVRQLLSSRGRWWHLHPRRLVRYRLAHSYRTCQPLRQGHKAPSSKGLRLSLRHQRAAILSRRWDTSIAMLPSFNAREQ